VYYLLAALPRPKGKIMNKVLPDIAAALVAVSFAGVVFACETKSDIKIESTVTPAGEAKSDFRTESTGITPGETKPETKKVKKIPGGGKRTNVVASYVAGVRLKIKEMTVEQGIGKTAVVSDSNMFFAGRTFAAFLKDPGEKNATYAEIKNIIDNWLNLSVGGAKSQDIIPIVEDYIEKWPNGKLVVSIGTNNIALDDERRLLGDYKSIIRKCKEKGTLLTFISILPRRPDQNEANETVDRVNNELENLCSQEGIRFFDASKPFRVSQDNPVKQVMKLFNMVNDAQGLHLSAPDGHLRWGAEFASVIANDAIPGFRTYSTAGTSRGERKGEEPGNRKVSGKKAKKPVRDVASQQKVKISDLEKMNRDKGANKVFILGDSNIFFSFIAWKGFAAKEDNKTDRIYPAIKCLLENSWNGGIAAAESGDLLVLYDKILKKWPQATVLISIGTNNIYFQSGTETLAADWKSFINKAKENGTKLKMVSILPRRPDQAAANKTVNMHNQKLQNLCAEEHVPYVDFHTPFAGHTDLFWSDNDGLHLNNKGQLLLGELLTNAMQ
jgi:lysophospholipase L1-like esterase